MQATFVGWSQSADHHELKVGIQQELGMAPKDAANAALPKVQEEPGMVPNAAAHTTPPKVGITTSNMHVFVIFFNIATGCQKADLCEHCNRKNNYGGCMWS